MNKNCENFIKLISDAVSAPRADNKKFEFGLAPISIPTSEHSPFNLETTQIDNMKSGDLIPMCAKNDNCAIQVIGYILTLLGTFSGNVCEGDISRAKRIITNESRIASDELANVLDFFKVNYAIYEIYDSYSEIFLMNRISSEYSIVSPERAHPASPDFVIVLANGHYDILSDFPLPI